MNDIRAISDQLQMWISPTGEVRFYVSDWYDRVKDVLEVYAREEWGAPTLDSMRRAKVWFDPDGEIHVDRLSDELASEVIKSNVLRSLFRCHITTHLLLRLLPSLRRWPSFFSDTTALFTADRLIPVASDTSESFASGF